MTNPSEIPDLYGRLDIHPDTPSSEIKRAYYDAAKKWHPDIFPENEKQFANKEFIAVSEAYFTLSNTMSRLMYDREQKYTRIDETNSCDIKKAYDAYVNMTKMFDEVSPGLGAFLRTPGMAETFFAMSSLMPEFTSIFGNYKPRPKKEPKQSGLERLLDNEKNTE